MGFRRALFFVALLLALAPGVARASLPWYYPPHAGKEFVNPSLTPERALEAVPKPQWEGQMVLWRGVVKAWLNADAPATPGLPEGTGPERNGEAAAQAIHRHPRHESFMVLHTRAGDVPVQFLGRVLTLDSDRTGYEVAVKGTLMLQGDRVVGLNGHSVILLQPPAGAGFADYMKRSDRPARDVTSFLEWWVGFHNPGYSPTLRHTVARSIVAGARRNGVDPLFLAALIQIESAFHIHARSHSGAIGLGQLMPFTARGLGVDPYDPRQNVRAAAHYIANLVRTWTYVDPVRDARGVENPLALALASYNAGPGRVRSCHGVPAIPETTNYVYFIGFVHHEMTEVAQRLGIIAAAEK